jgi:hypothetical protein
LLTDTEPLTPTVPLNVLMPLPTTYRVTITFGPPDVAADALDSEDAAPKDHLPSPGS